MNRCAIVATHHKTGTVWMNSTFKEICAALDIRYVQMNKENTLAEKDVKAPIVLFSAHPNFRNAPWIVENPEHRIFHLIRDPRDVIISGAHYHRVSNEKWLHVPRSAFGGKTYQQRINSLNNNRQRYIFEMNNSASKTIKRMKEWDYERDNSFECKYEELINDVDMSLFSKIAAHLGFDDSEMGTCREYFWKNSIFGDKIKESENGKTVHIRSGSSEQWRETFDRQLGRTFVRLFGDVLVELGYEPNNQWVKRLHRGSPAARKEASEDVAVDLTATAK